MGWIDNKAVVDMIDDWWWSMPILVQAQNCHTYTLIGYDDDDALPIAMQTEVIWSVD